MKKTGRVRYEIDPHNRLVYAKTGKISRVARFRTIVDGRFRIDKNNSLTYHIKKSEDSEIPQQVKLSGNWSLDKKHNLVLTLNKWGNQYAGNKLTIKGNLIDAKDNKISFAVATKDSLGKAHIYVLKLGGRWQADRHNRLIFDVKREKGETNELTLRGAWGLNRQNEIVYTHTKSRLKTKKKTTTAIILKGYWDITGKHRISYVLNKEIGSRLDFKVSVGKPTRRGLEYNIGIGVSPSKKTITILGKWRVNRKLALSFEIPSGGGKVKSIAFNAEYKLGKHSSLDLKLKNEFGDDLGMKVELSLAAGAKFRW